MLEEELRAASASGILQDVTSLLKKGAIFSADSVSDTYNLYSSLHITLLRSIKYVLILSTLSVDVLRCI